MEQINRIELRGFVGSVNTQTYPQGKVSHFTVAGKESTTSEQLKSFSFK